MPREEICYTLRGTPEELETKEASGERILGQMSELNVHLSLVNNPPLDCPQIDFREMIQLVLSKDSNCFELNLN